MNYMGTLKSILLCHSKPFDIHSDAVILMKLDEKDETLIDAGEDYSLKSINNDITIKNKNILFYGEIDVNNKTDAEIIERKGCICSIYTQSLIPSNFNYNNGQGGKTFYPTCSPVDWFKYCHCRIGKPKRVIAFKINPKLL